MLHGIILKKHRIAQADEVSKQGQNLTHCYYHILLSIVKYADMNSN
jgi:hypothetical protein